MIPWAPILAAAIATGQPVPPVPPVAPVVQDLSTPGASDAPDVHSPGIEPAPAASAPPSAPPSAPTQADPEKSALYERLLGDEPPRSAEPAPSPAPAVSTRWAWAILLAGLGSVGVWIYLQRRGGVWKASPNALVMLAHVPVGRQGSVALFRVEDEDGRFHRVLVGMGAGLPTLLTDLGPSLEGGADEDLPVSVRNRASAARSPREVSEETELEPPEFMRDPALLGRLEEERRRRDTGESDPAGDESGEPPLPGFIQELLDERERPDARSRRRDRRKP